MGNYALIVNKALNKIENRPLINPMLLEEESAATAQDGRSKEEESNKEDDKVANKDKLQSSIEQRQSALSASDISLDNYSTTPSS